MQGDSQMLTVFEKLEHLDLKGKIYDMVFVPLRTPGATCELYCGILKNGEAQKATKVAVKKLWSHLYEDPWEDHVSFWVF